ACLSPSEIASQLPIRNPDAPGPVLEIIVETGSGASLSPSEIAFQLPIRNPDVPGPVLEIIAEAGAGACLSPSPLIRNPDARLLPSEIASQLLFLAGCSIDTYSLHRRPVPDGRIERLYSAGPVSNFLTKNQDVINQDKVLMESRASCPSPSGISIPEGVPISNSPSKCVGFLGCHMLLLLGTWIEDAYQISLRNPRTCNSHLGSFLFSLTCLNLSPTLTWVASIHHMDYFAFYDRTSLAYACLSLALSRNSEGNSPSW
ncbi:caffeic acid 3-O-methyltransferase-like, partial [Fagus crenata]